MRRLRADGLGDLIAEPEPLGAAGQEAIAAWNFCGGWYPERLALFGALHGLPDPEIVLHLMTVIRNHQGPHG